MLSKTSQIEKLRKALIDERIRYLKLYEDAYPDVGMRSSLAMFEKDAIRQLTNEGVLHQGYAGIV